MFELKEADNMFESKTRLLKDLGRAIKMMDVDYSILGSVLELCSI